MKRRERWETSLAEYLYAALQQRFLYGSFDCCLFTAGAIMAQTGTDVAAAFRGKYYSKAEADVLVQGSADRIGPFADSVLTGHGMRAIERKQAKRGDVALVPIRDGVEALGIVDLNGTDVLVMLDKGLGRFPLRKALGAWTV